VNRSIRRVSNSSVFTAKPTKLLRAMYRGGCDPRLVAVANVEYPNLLRDVVEGRCPFCSARFTHRYNLFAHFRGGCGLVLAATLRDILGKYRVAIRGIRYVLAYEKFVVRYGGWYGGCFGSFDSFEDAYKYLRECLGW
jgi:hypothetical protein